MKRMAELVKKRARLIKAQQAGLPGAGLCEIHPGAASLRGPDKIVADEEGDLAPVRAGYRPASRIGMIKRDVFALLKGKPKEAVCGVKCRLDNFFELEIGFKPGLIEAKLLLAPLLGVVTPVPRRDLKIGALGGGDCLQRRFFLPCADKGALPHGA